MTRCKFCKNQAIVSIKIYGYNSFGCCGDCLQWVLYEIDRVKEKGE